MEFVAVKEALSVLGDGSLIVLVFITMKQTRVLLHHHTQLTKIETRLDFKEKPVD